MAQSQKKQKNVSLSELSELKVEQEWTEMTGPFFYIKTEDEKSFGPFQTHIISDYIDQVGLPTQTLLRDAKSLNDWQPLYSHPQFQRRRPSLVPTKANDQIKHLIILKDGKPQGPLTIQEIEDLISNKGLISTDTVSIDNGKSWVKLYQVPGFDQRTYSAAELPVNPEKSAEQELNQEISKASGQMANLVYIESQKHTNHKESDQVDPQK